jgi:hypothetical protein
MRKSASKEKVFDLSALSRAIPGPGDEIEGDPDSGVVESEKVTVVFLVSATGTTHHTYNFSASPWHAKRSDRSLRFASPSFFSCGPCLHSQCEQVSHHPPISAAYYCCPERGIEAVGMDQIVARVSGMCTWFKISRLDLARQLTFRRQL